MKELKIMWLHSHLTNWYGGTKFVYEVTKELSRRNHKITLFVQKSSEEIEKKFQEIPVDVKSLSNCSTGDVKFWFNFQQEIQKQTSYLKNEAGNFDVVISSMFPMNIVANSTSLPHLQYCFEPFAFFWDPSMINSLSLQKRLFLKIVKSFYGKLDVNSIRKADIVLTVNNGTKEWISKIYGINSVPTYLGVNINHFKKINDIKLSKFYNGKKIIIHSTDWTPIKRTSWLIDQFSRSYSNKEDIILLITEVIADGSDKFKALKIIKEKDLHNVILLGNLSYDLLPKYYSLADIAIYSGIGAGASSASLFVLECMACQTPVIRTNDSTEEIEHGKTGFLFEKNDGESLRKHIEELLIKDDLRLEFGTNARDFIIKKYTWENVVNIIEKECLSLII